MLNFKFKHDQAGQPYLATDIIGKALLMIPQLNKGTAFTQAERHTFGLMGKLPSRVESLDEQVQRVYHQFSSYNEPINRNLFLNHLLNTNQVLFYKLVASHLEEMLPIVYTPIVGNAVEQFHKKFIQPRGLYLSYKELDHIDEILCNRSNQDISLIVVSDGEGVLGIGDQGVGAMMIPIAKLMVYTAIGKINPNTTLPIMLDAGTNNQALLDSPDYLGWRHPRITGKQYDAFIETVIDAIKRNIPNVFLHWEDFGRRNALRNLAAYREQICSFNDDIQGTGVVAVAAILAALKRTKGTLDQQRIVIFGAGAAGMGVTEQITKALCRTGLSLEQARQCFWLVDRDGLIGTHLPELIESHQLYARDYTDLQDWKVDNPSHITLQEVIQHVQPTILIGASAQAGAFTESIIREMAAHVDHPIIFPLSNPTERAEATPADLLHWTYNQALVATGSPFAPIDIGNRFITISQCNNFLAFPGIGLGVLAIQAKQVNDNMLWAASLALSAYTDSHHTLLPTIKQATDASRAVAKAVAQSAVDQGLGYCPDAQSIDDCIDAVQWEPAYYPYHLESFEAP